MNTRPRDPDSGARLRVLILEDNPDDAELVLRELRRGGFEPEWERVETAEDFSAALTHEWDVILSDFSMPHFNAFGALEILEGRQNSPPCIVVSGTIGEDTAVAAIKAGAADYIMKDRLARLAATIRRELRDRAVRRLHEAEQRRAQDAIQRLFTAIEQTVDSIVMTDAEGRIQYVNPGFQKLYGYSKDEVLGKTPSILKSGRHDEAYYRAFWSSLISGQGFRGEIVNKTKDGRFLTVELSVRAIFDETGKRTGFIAVHHDIDEKERAEEALRTSEERFRLLAENIQEVFWLADPANHDTLYVSPGYETIWGRTCASLYAEPQTWLDAIYAEDRERIVQAVMTKQVNGTYDEEYRITRPDGEVRWIHDRAFAVRDPAGEVRRVVGVAVDVTEQNRARAELQESQNQLRALSAHLQIIREEERTGIARELHDELGQSLTALKMDLASIRRRVLSGDEDAGKAALRKIDAASQVADGMIHTIRRISSDLRPGMLDDLGLFPAIEWLANDFSQRMGIACRLSSELKGHSPDRARATAIFRILQETLTNVARHSKATEVDVRLAETDGMIELVVHDNGQGFSPEVLHKSTSLGLIGMRERALLVGGEVTFFSNPGDGATMRLRVPLSGPDGP